MCRCMNDTAVVSHCAPRCLRMVGLFFFLSHICVAMYPNIIICAYTTILSICYSARPHATAKRGTDHQSVADRPFAPAQTNQSFRYSSQNDTVNHSVQAPNHHIIPNRSDHDHNFHVSDSEGNMLIDDHDNIDLSLNLHVGDISQPDQQSVLAPPRSSHTQTPAVTIATDSDDNEPRSSSSARGGSANTSAHSLAGEREPLYMKRQSRMNQSRQYSHAATSKGGKVNQLTNAAVVNNNNSNATSLRESAAPLSSVSARAPRRPSVNPLLHLDFITPTPTATVVTAAVPLTATSMKTNP